jgi:hypothetical protein
MQNNQVDEIEEEKTRRKDNNSKGRYRAVELDEENFVRYQGGNGAVEQPQATQIVDGVEIDLDICEYRPLDISPRGKPSKASEASRPWRHVPRIRSQILHVWTTVDIYSETGEPARGGD